MLKKLSPLFALLTSGLTAGLLASTAQAADVGVSISISEPGIYGRIDIGKFPQPQIIVTQPVVIVQPRVRVVQQPEPIYLWVPPGHRANWRRHCAEYRACGVPVYFVQNDWYQQNVHKGEGRRHVKHDGKDHDKHRDKGHGKGKGHNKDD